jgi:hypothetical protein
MKYFVLLGLFLYTTAIISQKVTPQVVSSSGTIVENADIKISWTLGEFSVATIGTNPKLTQGFQQSKLIFETNVEDPLYANRINVFPNPSQDIVYIELQDISAATIVQFTDVSGNLIFQESFTNRTQFVVRHLPSGIYFTRIIKDGKIIHSTKILKI